MRRILVLVLVVTLLAGQAVYAGSAARFLDEDQAAWAAQYMRAAAVQAYLKGDPDGRFRPNDRLNRAELITGLVRFAGGEEAARAGKDARLVFEDAGEIQGNFPWFVGYLAEALRRNIVEPVGSFKPASPATRLFAAEALVKSLGLEGEALYREGVTLSFTDQDQIPAEKRAYVAIAVEKGLLSGYPDGSFQPGRALSRAEFAALLGRADRIRGWSVPDEVAGTVAGVDAGARTITVTVGSEQKRFSLAEEAVVILDGKAAALADIKAGSAVKLLVKDNAVRLVVARSPEDLAGKSLTLMGRLVKITGLEGGDAYALIADRALRVELMVNIRESMSAGSMADYRAVIVVPKDAGVKEALAGYVGQTVRLEGRFLTGPGVYMRPTFEAARVAGLSSEEAEVLALARTLFKAYSEHDFATLYKITINEAMFEVRMVEELVKTSNIPQPKNTDLVLALDSFDGARGVARVVFSYRQEQTLFGQVVRSLHKVTLSFRRSSSGWVIDKTTEDEMVLEK